MSTALESPLPSQEPMDVDPPTSFEQILVGAQQGSLPHLRQLVTSVSEHYPNHSQAILDAITTNLPIPDNLNGFEPTDHQLTSGLSALLALTEVARWYTTSAGARHHISPTILVSNDVAKKYLFWALIFIGAPASPTSPNPALQFVPPKMRLSLYHHATTFFRVLFKVPLISYQAFPSNLQATVLDVTIAWWVCLPNGEPPIYPTGQRGELEDVIDGMDLSTKLFFDLVHSETEAFGQAIIDGRVCPPQVFVQRTVGRMRAIGSLRNLTHLSHLPPTTSEIANLASMFGIASTFLQFHQPVRRVFIEEGASGAYIDMLTTLAERMEATVRDGVNRWTTPNSPAHWFLLNSSFIACLRITMGWSCLSPTLVLRERESLVSHGLVRLLALVKRTRPDEHKGEFDLVWDEISMYAPYLEVFPALYKDAMDHLDATLPDMYSRQMFGTQPQRAIPRVEEDFNKPENPRDLRLSIDIDCMTSMSQFVAKERRVRLCDNLKHYSRLSTDEESTSREEHACSRCHTAVYCSQECQQEDWRAFHRKECVHMAKAYADAKSADQVYSYDNRTFQTSIIRHEWESLLANKDRSTEAIPYTFGRNGVTMVDIYRPVGTLVLNATNYVDRELPHVPLHLRPRFSEYLKTFVDTNGAYQGGDPAQVRAQNRRLLGRSFCLGDKDVNLLILLRRVNYVTFEGSGFEVYVKSTAYRNRGPEFKSDFLIEGVLTYLSPPRTWTRSKFDIPTRHREATGSQ